MRSEPIVPVAQNRPTSGSPVYSTRCDVCRVGKIRVQSPGAVQSEARSADNHACFVRRALHDGLQALSSADSVVVVKLAGIRDEKDQMGFVRGTGHAHAM